jgi:predicted DNA-binding transcriptional regulator AlpA
MKQTKSQNKISTEEILKNFDNQPASGFIRLPVLMRLYSVSAPTIWRGVKKGTIPKPVKLSERVTAWNIGEIRSVLAAKAGF